VKYYYFECTFCDGESQVSSDIEPQFCPLCGNDCNAQLVEYDDEDEED